MKNLLLILLISLSLISCIDNDKVKIISTNEKALVIDYDEVYSKGDTLMIWNGPSSDDWKIDVDWIVKSDTVMNMITYKIAVVTE
ncbi:MAG TPA: hypothetical protein VF680_16970 [Allosphingosinicella sp.]|jgi:hypothetical protein